MSPVWLYCVTTADGGPPDELAGVAGAPVRVDDVDGLHAWYSEPESLPDMSADAVARHHRVVEAAWDTAISCVPARYGQSFRDADALRAELRARIHDLLRSLAALEETAEMGLRVFPTTGSAADEAAGLVGGDDAAEPTTESGTASGTGPGRAYLERLLGADRTRRARAERSRILADDVVGPLAQFVLASKRDTDGSETGGVALAHLVPRGSIQEYRDTIAGVVRERDDVRIVVEGPWPPYSFASREEGA